MYILKGGRSSTKTPIGPKYEDRLLGFNGQPGMIERGSLTDKDINFILDSGDSKLLSALERKYEKEKKNSEHVKRIYGDAFDNKDNDGNLFKDKSLDIDMSKTMDTPEDVKKMKTILNK